MVQASGVARVYGDRKIIENVDLEIGPGERLGLIGANGSGKSTLLRLLAGLEPPDAGHIRAAGRVALLEQHTLAGAERVLDAVTPPELRRAQQAFEAAMARLGSGSETDLNAFALAEDAYRLAGGYAFAAQAEAVLAGLDLHAAGRTDQLSGGQVRRVMLARLLLSPAEVYLLDEPTNHLDAAGSAWLEGWIAASPAAFVLASHDRAFLDAVTTTTAELKRAALSLYPGNYSAAMTLKATLREAQERDHAAYTRKRQALDEERRRRQSKARSAASFNPSRASDANKLLAKGKAENAQNVNASRAKVLQKQIERLDAQATAKPFEDRRTLRLSLSLPPAPLGPAEVLRVEGLTVQRGESPVLSGVTLHVRRGDRVALSGPNGGGKSTLLGALLGDVAHVGTRIWGTVTWGAGLGRYALRQHGEELRGLNTIGEALLDANPDLTPHQRYDVAAQVGLPAPSSPLAALSGGQRTRLSLARLSVTRAQVLVLDEPTNHLDLPMIEALETLLRDFAGTVLFATHDRRLLDRVATRVWAVGNGTVQEA